MGCFSNAVELDTAYNLPRGGREAVRLTAQHHVLTTRQGWLLHPTIAHAVRDIPQPRIADVATGTGIWAIEVAEQIPNAEVTGLDISDQQFSPAWTWPSNLSLGLYDLLDDVPAEYKGQFDVVHVRLLLTAGPSVDKTVFINQFRTLLRPGGWLQWDELTFPHISSCYPSSTGVFKPEDLGSHPMVQVMQKYLKFGDKASWLNQFEQVFAKVGGWEQTEKVDVPVRSHLLQMESDLVLAVKVEFVSLATQKGGGKDALMVKELNEALDVLCKDIKSGMLFSYNWNVCIARKASLISNKIA